MIWQSHNKLNTQSEGIGLLGFESRSWRST